MKAIANIVNASLILALSSAFPNTYEITHYVFMQTVFSTSFHSQEKFIELLETADEEAKKQICRDVFSARIFIDERSSIKDKISETFKEEIRKLINSNLKTQITTLPFTFIYSDVKCILCFSSKKIEFYLSDITNFREWRWFVLYRERGMENLNVLGFAEPNWMFPSNIPKKQLDYQYYRQLITVQKETIEKNNKYFREIYASVLFRKCAVAVKYFINDRNPEPFESYVVQINRSIDNAYQFSMEINLKLDLYSNIFNVSSPALVCVVRQHPTGAVLPPLSFYIIPDPSNKRASYLVEEVEHKKFKLKTHVQSALEIEDVFNVSI